MALFGRKRPEENRDGFFAGAQNDGMQDDSLRYTERDGMKGVGAFARDTGSMMINEALMTPVVGKEQVHKAMQTLREYMTGKARLDSRIIEDDKWWRQRHWDVIRENGTTELHTKSAWLVNVVLSKHADAMDAMPEPNFLPRAEDDKEEALKLSKIAPVILDNAEFDAAWTENWWRKLKFGLAVYGVFWDKNQHHGLGDVAIRAIDPLKIYWQPGVTRLQDSRNLFLLEMMDNEVLEEQYPELKGKLGGKDVVAKEFYHDDHISTADKSTVVDWYYKKKNGGKTILHYVKFVGEFVLYATENDADRTESGLYDHGLYPFFFDVLYPEEGTPAGYGNIDLNKDAQRQIDLMNNAIVANCVASATPRWMKRGEDGINEEEFADWSKPIVHVAGSIEENAIKQITVAPLSGNYIAILQNKIDEMKETSGNRDVNSGGAPAGVTAASAIAALQEQSGKLSRDSIRNSYACFKDMVSCMVELIRQFYDAPRTFRITGENGQDQFVSYDNSNLQQTTMVDPITRQVTISKPEFDVNITIQKQTEYTKMARNELALQLYQLGFFSPGNADSSLAALEMMDFDGKEEIIQLVQTNGTLLQMLQQAQAENIMLKAALGMPAAAPGVPQAGGAQGGAPSGQPVKNIPQGDAMGGMMQGNRVADKARAQAQAATQPG